MNYAIRSSLNLLLILDTFVSSDRVSVSSEVSQHAIDFYINLVLSILYF